MPLISSKCGTMFTRIVLRALALENGLTDGELERAERIARNNTWLVTNRLSSMSDAQHEVLRAYRVSVPGSDKVAEKCVRKRKKGDEDAVELRRSRRLMKKKPIDNGKFWLGARGYLHHCRFSEPLCGACMEKNVLNQCSGCRRCLHGYCLPCSKFACQCHVHEKDSHLWGECHHNKNSPNYNPPPIKKEEPELEESSN